MFGTDMSQKIFHIVFGHVALHLDKMSLKYIVILPSNIFNTGEVKYIMMPSGLHLKGAVNLYDPFQHKLSVV